MNPVEVIEAMARSGNPNSVSDAGVGALCARSAIMGAHLNVKINAAGLADRSKVSGTIEIAADIEKKAIEKETEILAVVNKIIQTLS